MDDSTLVSVVVPTLNAGEQFAGLLGALHSQRVPGRVEILIIDSGSRDGTRERASRFGAKVLSIPQRRFNHGRARNLAIEASRGQFVALTVQDAVPTSRNWLAKLLSPLLNQSEIAGSYGVQVAPPWAALPARARNSAWRKGNSGHVVRSLDAPEQFYDMTPEERLASIRFDNVTGCIRRSVWERSPFPERRYGEDMAWAKSALFKGYKIAHVPSARVWHYHEREWLYRLRRAYLDGFTRVQLVGWPASDLTLEDVYRALRMTRLYLSGTDFDAMTDPVAIRRFLREEIRRCEPPVEDATTRLYASGLEFSWSLLENALRYCGDGILPGGVWTDLFRFAIVSEVGKEIGATAATRLAGPVSARRLVWGSLHRLLSAGV